MTEHWSMRYLRHVLDRTGFTPTKLAAEAGMSSTTLTRPLNNPDHTFNLSRRTLDSIQKATGISYAPFASGEMAQPLADMTDHELLDTLTPAGREKARQYILFVKSQEGTS